MDDKWQLRWELLQTPSIEYITLAQSSALLSPFFPTMLYLHLDTFVLSSGESRLIRASSLIARVLRNDRVKIE